MNKKLIDIDKYIVLNKKELKNKISDISNSSKSVLISLIVLFGNSHRKGEIAIPSHWVLNITQRELDKSLYELANKHLITLSTDSKKFKVNNEVMI